MTKLSSKSLLGVALVLSLAVAVLVYNFFNNLQSGTSARDEESVVIAKREIPANTLITEDMVDKVTVPRKTLQPGAITELARVVGVYAKETIPASGQLTDNEIFDSRAVGFTGSIPHDKRAVSIAVTDVTGVAGLIKPGDFVDVIVVLDPGVANMLLQNVLVLATDKTVARQEQGAVQKDAKVTTVTIAVTPDEATTLGLAGKKGTITLALRPYVPVTGAGFAQVGAKTLDNLAGYAGYAVAAASAPAPAAAPASVPVPNLSLQNLFPHAPATAPANKGRTDHDGMKAISVIRGTTSQDVYVE